MNKNVGTTDAILRITCGLFGVAWGTARMTRSPNDAMPVLITMASAMKVAEGITRFCPMLQAMGVSTIENKQNKPNAKTDNNSGEKHVPQRTERPNSSMY